MNPAGDISIPEDVAKRFCPKTPGKEAKSLAEVKGSENGRLPINERLQDKKFYMALPLKPREYQVQLCLEAQRKNVIIYLGTGLGKTFITVMFLKSPQIADAIQAGRKVAFLAPTQDLTKQQAEYIFGKTPYRVRVYCGRTSQLGIHIDNWSRPAWLTELKSVDILFMTPDIFCNAISNQCLEYDDFSTVIFDECHHACKNKSKESKHAYKRVLEKMGYASTPPKVIGLTASLINHLPKDEDSIVEGIIYLEKLMKANCVTDLKAIEKKPQMVIHTFNDHAIDKGNDILLNLLQTYSEEMRAALNIGKAKKLQHLNSASLSEENKKCLAFLNKLKLASKGFSIKPGSFEKVLSQLADLRLDCGLWAFSHICLKLVRSMEEHSKSSVISPEIKPVYLHFAAMLRKMLLTTNQFLGDDKNDLLIFYNQPKLMALLQTLKTEYDGIQKGTSDKATFSAVVFVRRRISVVAICSWLQAISENIPEYSFIKADYAIGLASTMSSKWACITRRKASEQSGMLENFRKGILNVIITTSVLEEGIDLPVCSTVVRFDRVGTFREYVQSRGRARQTKASYIALCSNSDQSTVQSCLDKFNDIEYRVRKVLTSGNRQESLNPRNENQNRARVERSQEDTVEPFTIEGTKVNIDPCLAKTILHMYVARLSKRHPFGSKIHYEHTQQGNLYTTKLFFPPGCPIKDCLGLPKSNLDLSVSSAVVEAIRALYEARELDEHAVPIRSTEEHVTQILAKQDIAPVYEPLSKELEGEPVDGTTLAQFDWKAVQLSDRISRGPAEKQLKLFRICFNEVAGKVRSETKHFFHGSKIGLIVDAATSMSSDSWPTYLYNHYGEFSVTYELVDGQFTIPRSNMHNNYLNYTHNLLTRCLGFRIGREDFRRNCVFYIVPLDQAANINLFRQPEPSNRPLRAGDLVKVRANYRRDCRNSIYLVRHVHLEMNPRSQIPKMRVTFYDYMVSKHGDRSVASMEQPIIEVMPLAKEFASTTQGKKIDVGHSTASEFYLDQFFDLLDYDPALVFQAYNLPPLIYSLYVSSIARELSTQYQDFIDTKRGITKIKEPEKADEIEDAVMSNDDDDSKAEEDGGESDVGEEDDSEDYSTDDSASIIDTSDEDDEAPVPKSHLMKERDILCRQVLDLSNRGENKIEMWDMNEYSVRDLQKLTFNYRYNQSSQRYVNTHPKYWSTFSKLEGEIRFHHETILEKLRQIQRGILSDENFVGEEDGLSRKGLQVDLSIKPSLRFDRRKKPLREGSLAQAFVEALTQRRADSCRNLEALENIGDTFLKYFTSIILYHKLEDQHEGLLTSARSALTCNKHFTYLAKKSHLGSYAISSKYHPNVLNIILGGTGSCKNKMRPKDLADTFESLVGACLIYGGEYQAILALEWLGLKLFDDRSLSSFKEFSEFHEHGVSFVQPKLTFIDENDPQASEMLKQCKHQVKRLETILNYRFNDLAYLVLALTHASDPYRPSGTYERFEFVGDAILDYLVTITLYMSGVNTPGQLTSSRSALVNNASFAKLALKHRYDFFIRYLDQEMFDELKRVNDHMVEDPEMNFLNMSDFDMIAKLLGDIYESVAAAIYFDSGCSLDTVWSIYYPMMKDLIDEEIKNPTKSVITQLYETFPGSGRIRFEFYKVPSLEGDAALTAAKLTIDSELEYFGDGHNKHQAKLRAVESYLTSPPTPEVKQRLDEDYSKKRPSRNEKQHRDRPQSSRGGGGGYRGRGRPFKRGFRRC